MTKNHHDRFYLSTEGYYFQYRWDKNNPEIERATLYNLKNERISDTMVSAGYGLPQKTHHNIINLFESELFLMDKNNNQ